jgi:glycosyltransferase involved in cell wall biosynthesis
MDRKAAANAPVPLADSAAPARRVPPRLCVVYTAKNSTRTLPRSIAAVREIADRIVVVDSGSMDGTQDACRALGAEVVHQEWLGFARQKQHAIDLAADAEFVLLLDSDEIPDARLIDSIRGVIQSPGSAKGWWIDRRYWFGGDYVRIDAPDRVLRLFRQGAGSVPFREVHEVIRVDGPTARLPGICRHESWIDLEDALAKQLRYARMSASAPHARSNLVKLAFNPSWAFIRNYVLHRAFLDGWRGFQLSLVVAMGTLAKHLMILDRKRR